MPIPDCAAASPLPPMVCIPAIRSVFSAGIGNGSQRNRCGDAGASSKGAVRHGPGSTGLNRPCAAEGRMR